jgi:hypothetical protein
MASTTATTATLKRRGLNENLKKSGARRRRRIIVIGQLQLADLSGGDGSPLDPSQ